MRTSILIALSLAFLLVAAVFAEQVAEQAQAVDASSDRKPLLTVVPAYPKRALRDRLEGDVEVCFNVDRGGRTSRIAVRRSSNRLFEDAAKQAVRRSTYVPLPKNQVMSGIKTCRTFQFRLDPASDAEPAAESVELEP